MNYISLFSGIGGFDLGFDRAGMKCVLQVEKDKKARAVLAHHWPNVPRMELVENVTKKNLRKFGIKSVDLVCGGFPCQDLSVAGKRKGLAGERSGLWFEFLRVIEMLRPGWVVIENVPGLLSSDSGRDMGTILNGLGQCGYWWAYRVLDAQFWGVPQRRRRVFIVASTRKFAPQEILFERDSSPWDTPPGREAGAGIAQAAIRRAQTSSNGWGIKEDGSTGTLDQTGGDAVLVAHSVRPRSGMPQGWNNNLIAWDNGQGDPNAEESELSYTLNGQANQGVCATFDPRNITSKANRTRVEFGLPANTLHQEGLSVITNAFNGYTGGADDNDAQANHLVVGSLQAHSTRHGHAMGTQQAAEEGQLVVAFDWRAGDDSKWHIGDNGKHKGGGAKEIVRQGDYTGALNSTRQDAVSGQFGVRRLTPLECERLQGFPDGWTDIGQSDSARYRQLGNAVCVPVVEWIGRQMIELIKEVV